jgi:hypothetical protein
VISSLTEPHACTFVGAPSADYPGLPPEEDTGPVYEELDLQLTLDRAKNIISQYPDSAEAAEARAFLLVEV